ncbi:MAG: hypothetical protein ACOY5Y_15185 [Pseudomonadota bacterium]
MDRRALLGAALALAAAPAFAIDPGTASGRYADGETQVGFSHAIALELDNAEGFRDSARQYRILLSDRAVPIGALYGLAFPPVWSMAKKDEVRGVLLSIDPDDPNSLVVTVFAPPEPGYSFTTWTLSNSEGLWERLSVEPTRIAGALREGASERVTLQFSAPVFTDAVEADLKGAAARSSEPVKVLLARAEAIRRGDMAAAAALSTPSAAENFRDAPPELLEMAPRMAAELTRRLRAADRVVIRRETAAVMLGEGEWASLARVDGVWKAAD